MTANEKLVEFMREKQKRLARIGVGVRYFTEEDAQDLVMLEKETAERIWKTIKNDIERGGACGLTEDVCPFCVLYRSKDCRDCGYRKRHGKCSSNRSTYAKVKKIISRETELSYTEEASSFCNEFYRNLIKQIENESKEGICTGA